MQKRIKYEKIFLFISSLALSLMIHATGFEANGIYYNIISDSERTVEIRTAGNQTGAIIIPQQVTYDRYYYYTVIGISDYAFIRRSDITSISLPKTIEKIGENAFYQSGITSFTVPEKTTSIASSAFLYCVSSFNVDPKNKAFKAIDGVLYSYDMKTIIFYPSFKNNNSFSIPSGIESIGEMAFYWNSLSSLTIPSTVKSIGNGAFMVSRFLASLSIPSSVTNIGKNICRNCWSLTAYEVDKANKRYSSSDGIIFSKDLDTLIAYPNGKTEVIYQIPTNVKCIGENAFSDNTYLSTVIISNEVINIGIAAFSSTSITSINIPNNVENIENSAFSNCVNLKNVVLPINLNKIGDATFSECKNLASILIPESIKRINVSAFKGCIKLDSIELPNGVESIGDEAFYNCKKLSNVQIPNSVIDIGKNAFDSTAWLDKQQNGIIYINSNLYKYKGAMPTNTSIEVKEGTIQICGGAFSGCKGLVSIKVASTLKIIGANVFSDCIGLKNITLPNSLTTIGSNAFTKSGITSLTVPINVINFSSVGQCDSLKSVHILGKIKSIGNYAFYQCKSLSSIKLPNSIINIGSFAFYWCSKLKSITFSSALRQIGAQAFAYCDRLDTIQSKATTPPDLGLLSFYGVGRLTILQVPTGSRALYSKAEQWKDFANINEVNFTHNYQIKITNTSCPNSNDGRIEVLTLMPYKYILDITGNNYSKKLEFSGNTYSLSDLLPGTYQLNFSVQDIDTLKQMFTVNISQPEELSVYKVKMENSKVTYNLNGGEEYFISNNGKKIECQSNIIDIPLQTGENNITIRTEKVCQGLFEDKIYFDGKDQITFFPNPAKDNVFIYAPCIDEKVTVKIASLNGVTLLKQTLAVQIDCMLDVDISSLTNGSYLVNVTAKSINKTIKLIKE